MKFNNLVNNLDVLNSINVNDKLIITDTKLSVDKPTKFRSIFRFINNQNRERSYVFIYNLIDNITLELDKFKIYQAGKSFYKLHQLNIQNDQQFATLFWKLIDLKNAVTNLKKTYYNDINYVKRLDFLNKIIEDNRTKLNN